MVHTRSQKKKLQEEAPPPPPLIIRLPGKLSLCEFYATRDAPLLEETYRKAFRCSVWLRRHVCYSEEKDQQAMNLHRFKEDAQFFIEKRLLLPSEFKEMLDSFESKMFIVNHFLHKTEGFASFFDMHSYQSSVSLRLMGYPKPPPPGERDLPWNFSLEEWDRVKIK